MEYLKDMVRKPCHDCGAEPGQYHLENCDTERCPKCYGQLLSCGCFVIHNGEDECIFDEEEFNEYEREKWTGIMYEGGKIICEQLNLYSKMVPGQGWVPCSEYDEGASHDLNEGVYIMMKYGKPKLKKII